MKKRIFYHEKRKTYHENLFFIPKNEISNPSLLILVNTFIPKKEKRCFFHALLVLLVNCFFIGALSKRLILTKRESMALRERLVVLPLRFL